MIRISLAGRLVVEVDGVPVEDGGLGRIGRTALAYLVDERHRPVPRAELAEVLWGEALPRSWETSLRGTALRVRGVLGAAGLAPADALTSSFGCWELHLPPGTEVDVEVAVADIRRAEAALAAGRVGEARAAAAAAAAVAARRFLPEGAGHWVERRQDDLRELHLHALELGADAALAAGDVSAAVRAAEEAVSVEPLRESAYLRLMRAHAAGANRGEALRAYERARSVLAEELGVSPSPATEAAYLALLGEEGAPSPQPAAGRPPAPAVPTPLTRLVGRDEELAQVATMLGGARLLTLTGTGGVGKTRLAVAAAADAGPGQPDGAVLVELAPLADAELLPQHVLGALGLREEPGRRPLDTLTAHLRARQLLLVLDNCEHLVAAAAALAESLLRSCPRLTVLATSREPLGVPGEVTWRVPSLSAEAAAALFAERAGAVRPDLSLSPADGALVRQLCRRLDNIPLAIELAAARVGALTVQEITDRLDDRFRLLSGGARTALPRQQTLRALIDWTYDALSPAERRLFERLAVFGAGFDLEAAEAVVAGEGFDGHDVLPVLSGLVDKSLVVAEAGPAGRTRYRLLETIRLYAQERLAESPEAAAVRSRHLDWAAGVAAAAQPALDGPDQAAALDRLDAMLDELRVALAWGTSGADPEPAVRLAVALSRFWEVRGHLSEGRAWLEAALAAGGGGDSPGLRAAALNSAAVLAQHQGDYAAARGLYEHSLALRRRLDDRLGTAAALLGLGNVSALQGQLAPARRLFEESLAIGRDLGHAMVVAASLTNLGWVAQSGGDLAAAEGHYLEALAARRRLGDAHGVAMVLANMGDLALQRGEIARARTCHEEALALRRQVGDRSGVADSLAALGRAAVADGDLATASALHTEGLEVRRASGDRPGMPTSLCALAELARLQGDAATASALLEESLEVATDLDDRHCITLSLLHMARLAADQGDATRARSLYRRAMPVLDDAGRPPPTASTATWLEGMAGIAGRDLRPERAARLLGAAAALRQSLGTPLPAHEAAALADTVAATSAALGEERFRELFEEGRALPLAGAARLATG